MARESKKAKQERVLEVCKRMDTLYPDALSALDYHDPFTLTIAVLLSAQTTDKAVNKVTPELFGRWPPRHREGHPNHRFLQGQVQALRRVRATHRL